MEVSHHFTRSPLRLDHVVSRGPNNESHFPVPELSPRSDSCTDSDTSSSSSSSSSSTSSPRKEDAVLRFDSRRLAPAGHLRSVQVSSSFLIRDILSDSEESCQSVAEPESRTDNALTSDLDSQSTARGLADGAMLGARFRRPRKRRTASQTASSRSSSRRFERQKYLSSRDRMELAGSLGLSSTQVKTWYQNRRTKWKRQCVLVGPEMLQAADAGSYSGLLRAFPSPLISTHTPPGCRAAWSRRRGTTTTVLSGATWCSTQIEEG
ncbi:hypothetical protein CRUP_033488 [Coryphaenoides rupestris]|nr:hypothetical protein CRUP_033488 [Coryphaenoides rupestris]